MAVMNPSRTAVSWPVELDGGRAASALPALAEHAVTVCCAVGAAFAAISLALAAAGLFGFASYTILSGSMAPALPVGSIVLTQPVAAADVAPGDVITFQAPGRPYTVTHRVAGILGGPDGERFLTKGDANPVADAWQLPASGTYRRVVLDIPYVGLVRSALATPAGRLDLLALAVLLCLVALAGDRQQPEPGPAPALRLPARSRRPEPVQERRAA